MIVYRVQDRAGRGPFKPGMSHRWLDDNDKPLPPSIFEDFPGVIELMNPKFANGCAFRDIKQVKLWFSGAEMRRMHLLGYRLYKLEADFILGESDHQLVISRKRPFTAGITQIAWP